MSIPIFSLELDSDPFITCGEEVLRGRLLIDSFQEVFMASLSYWTRDDYLKQWRSGLERICSNGCSAMVTNMYDPSQANFIVWWPLYREGESVYIQNQVLFLSDLTTSFCEARLYDCIPARETVNEDGEKISEWKLPLESIKRFLRKCGLERAD